MVQQRSQTTKWFAPEVSIYDTTLRDGTQGEGVNLSIEDKLKIAERLDEFGVTYIEGGWPLSNPKDIEFFRLAQKHKWKNAKVAAFGSTRRAKLTPEQDPNLAKLVESGAPVVTIFGKSWDFHVTHALRVTLEQNLEMIYDSVRFLCGQGLEVLFDAEHFFDGYKGNAEYALATLDAAAKGDARCLVLCDTNGGALPWEVAEIMRAVRAANPAPIGIHVHDDSGLATANTLIAIQEGAVHVQGTINGYGERCGNANLCAIIPIIQLKLNKRCVPEASLAEITEVSRFVDEICNMVPIDRMPFVGRCAFTHKAGMHVDAMMKHPQTYEHVAPETVGNDRRVLISELAGSGSVIQKAKKYNVDLYKGSPEIKAVLDHVVHLEHNGYSFEGAEASFELLLKKSLGMYRKLFDLKGFRLIIEKRGPDEEPITEATLKISVDGQEAFTVAEGDGPVHALDNALRLALKRFYGKQLSKIKLSDFKVRVVNTRAGTAAKVRTMIESRDQAETWTTVGVSTNIIEASWSALADSVEYGLLKHLDE
ncbi:MAG: citramalate synthase [Armatimonadetes bacterium]|nr:citramalate synthase [Armatimonadota bacterium]